MDENTGLVMATYTGLITPFTETMAKVYTVLLTSDVKTADTVRKEVSLTKTVAYVALNKLAEQGLVKKINSKPTQYYCTDPIQAFENIVKTKVHDERKQKLEQAILKGSVQSSKEYLIKIGAGSQTKLINHKTMQFTNDYKELIEIKQRIENIIREMPEKEKQMAFTKL